MQMIIHWSNLSAARGALSKAIKKRSKAEFNRQAYIVFENGYKLKAFREIYQLLIRCFLQSKKLFGTQKRTRSTTLVSSDMNEFIFVHLFYIVWSFILLVFVLHKLIGPLLPHH